MMWISSRAGRPETTSPKKVNELLAGVPCRGLAVNFSCFGVERCVKRQRAVSVILKTMALGASWAQRQHRVEAVERLNGAFLIDTKHCRVLGRMQVEADDVSGFCLEIRIIAGHVALQTGAASFRLPARCGAPNPC